MSTLMSAVDGTSAQIIVISDDESDDIGKPFRRIHKVPELTQRCAFQDRRVCRLEQDTRHKSTFDSNHESPRHKRRKITNSPGSKQWPSPGNSSLLQTRHVYAPLVDDLATLHSAPAKGNASPLATPSRIPSSHQANTTQANTTQANTTQAQTGPAGVRKLPRRNVQRPVSYDVRPKYRNRIEEYMLDTHPQGRHTNGRGDVWSDEETRRLIKLRLEGQTWSDLRQKFPTRTEKALESHYYKVHQVVDCGSPSSGGSLNGDHVEDDPLRDMLHSQERWPRLYTEFSRNTFAPSDADEKPPIRIGKRRLVRRATTVREPTEESENDASTTSSIPRHHHTFDDDQILSVPTLDQLLRGRESGAPARCGREAAALALRQTANTAYTITKVMDGASGDVSTVAWSPDGEVFAAGAVAISDPASMQYNLPNNLLIGHVDGVIKELPDHHIPRVSTSNGPNALASMQETQDPRVFTTVQMVAFAPDYHMFSASLDGALNVYSTQAQDVAATRLVSRHQYDEPLNCLAVCPHQPSTVAVGRNSTRSDSVFVWSIQDDLLHLDMKLGTTTPGNIYPSTVKWGATSANQQYLLVGFAQDEQVSYGEEGCVDVHGETCLFDVEHQASLYVESPKRAVFDMAWNPNPTGRTAFAVASVAEHFGRSGIFSMVRLYSRNQRDLKHVMELDCPARDINDVIYCPYDENLIAAGSTDGKVYIWDTRWYKKSEGYQRRYKHGSCLSVLAHQFERWEVDTGIRFLAWGQESSRLYSASSDGIVKCWNPYLDSSESQSLVEDVATFKSNVMSGAFTQDFSKLLIGEDRGRISLLDLGMRDEIQIGGHSEAKFDLLRAPEPAREPSMTYHEHLLDSGILQLAPMGALPVRQVVQGPNYRNQALNKVFASTMNGEEDILEAEYSALLNQDEDSADRPQARELQATLKAQRDEWKKLRKAVGFEIKSCDLDCGFKPHFYADDEEDTQVVDSGRTTDRIPAQLRSIPPIGTERFRLGLYAICGECGQPARPGSSDGAISLCESCGFACLRCGATAALLKDRVQISCEGCHLSWRADCLGYYPDPQHSASGKQHDARAGHIATSALPVHQEALLHKIGFQTWTKEEVMDELDGSVFWAVNDGSSDACFSMEDKTSAETEMDLS